MSAASILALTSLAALSSPATVRDAEVALDAGDYEKARDISEELGPQDPRVKRVHALSWARDPRASQAEARDAVFALVEIRLLGDDPAAETDLGEGLARLPSRQKEAFALLRGLADRDLIGSAYAYAALARVAAKQDDAPTARMAKERCLAMAVTTRACGETLARGPLLRARPRTLAVLAACALLAALMAGGRWWRRRRIAGDSSAPR